jgi:hypothetical protein
MTVTVFDRALVAGDAGRVTGERQERPDPEVPERARRRSFTAQYKLDVVAEYDAAGLGARAQVPAISPAKLRHSEVRIRLDRALCPERTDPGTLRAPSAAGSHAGRPHR